MLSDKALPWERRGQRILPRLYLSYMNKNQLNKYTIPITWLLCLLPAIIQAQTSGQRGNFQPERILLTWTGNPSTSATVTWRTGQKPTQVLAEITRESSHVDFDEETRKVKVITEELKTGETTVYYHRADFTNLAPATVYVYRVGDGKAWSEWLQFTTVPEKSDTLRFIYLGDAQNRLDTKWPKVIRKAYADMPQAAFILHAGDLINHSTEDEEWGQWFAGGNFIHATIPCVAAIGNHEYIKNEAGHKIAVSPYWDPQFNFPANGPKDLSDQTYYLDLPNLKMIVLNSNKEIDKQAPWLEQVLKNNQKKWTIISFHHPIYSAATGRENKDINQYWKPLFDKYKVDLILQGHDHVYARGNAGDTGKDTPVYAVSVSGGKMYKLSENPGWAKVRYADLQLYQTISLENNRLVYKSKAVTGEVKDHFELHKQGNGTSKITEKMIQP